jgi:hypothetical protein
LVDRRIALEDHGIDDRLLKLLTVLAKLFIR